MRRLLILLALLCTACTSDAGYPLLAVEGSTTHGVVRVHEAITKGLTIRVDAFVEVESYVPGMMATFVEGSCTSPGRVLQVLGVHPPDQGGAADVLLAEGRLGDLEGHSIHLHAGPPEVTPRLACADL